MEAISWIVLAFFAVFVGNNDCYAAKHTSKWTKLHGSLTGPLTFEAYRPKCTAKGRGRTGSNMAKKDACELLVYRTTDGSCNNVMNKKWGSIGQPYQRLLAPEYTVISTNVYAPRLKSEDGSELPNVRNISREIHGPKKVPSTSPVMVMQWGQFLDHDLSATPINLSNKTCCSKELVDENKHHGDVYKNGPCFPFIIPGKDYYYEEPKCMENKRSYQTMVGGVPEQVNMVSSFVDGSQVYGRSDDSMKLLRSTEKGKGRLLEKDNYLPEGASGSCIISQGQEATDYCLLAGDPRVNGYPGLGAMHTVFMRMHNIIADGLTAVHSDWDDDKVFQEARRINIAILQKITYSDWLPVIVGVDAVEKYGLASGGYTYREKTNATLYNVFSAAAFRFGHSMVPDGLVVNNELVKSRHLFNNPHHVLRSLDSLVLGLAMNTSERNDRFYSTGMTDHMFERDDYTGFDIVSLNIQRGRDHGLAPYYKWQSLCNSDTKLESEEEFDKQYKFFEDVDLYSGALDEAHVEGGSVGETYACLIGLQFEQLKYGDRFWYENENSPHPFSLCQIEQIELQTLASVICQTTEIESLQKNVFDSVSDENPMIDCRTVKKLEYNLF